MALVRGECQDRLTLTAAPELIHRKKQPLSSQSLHELLRAACELFVNNNYD